MPGKFTFTSESVSEGHPDKMCDQISDAIVDAALAQDADSRLGLETLVKSISDASGGFEHHVILAGEITTKAELDCAQIVRDTVEHIGYTDDALGFNCANIKVTELINHQSKDIAKGIDEHTNKTSEQGAGDQGLMFGFACNETEQLMPLPIQVSHDLVRRQAEVRRSGQFDWLGPDAKSQVSVEYSNAAPRIHTVVLSTQHRDHAHEQQVHEVVNEHIIQPVIKGFELADNLKIHINPTGKFTVGGPQADCGLTGRKIIVDTYGGMARHGGGAFSGKDPSKVDRSAAYYARYIAKNIVGGGLARKCEVQIAYAIGVAKPVSVMVDTYGTAASGLSDDELSAAVQQVFSLQPREIINDLNLLRPIYKDTAAYGHFGRTAFPWEQVSAVSQLKAELNR